MMNNEIKFYKFSVYHPNGEKWTDEEVNDYIFDHGNSILDFWSFVIDESGQVYAMDKCGMTQAVNSEKFIIKFDE